MTKVALITGAAQGLGYSIAAQLYAAGYAVVLSDISLEAAQDAARRLDSSSERVLALRLDVVLKDDFEHALEAILDRFGVLDVVVNNAALTLSTPLMQISPEEFERVTNINQRGTFIGCQVLGAYLADKGYGRIINMASQAGQNPGTATGGHYAASKGAIITLTKIFAQHLAANGVTVNAIAPGPIDSPAVDALVSPEDRVKLIETIPVKRLGNADFIGRLVVQLAGEDAFFVTGATWDVNGGTFMR